MLKIASITLHYTVRSSRNTTELKYTEKRQKRKTKTKNKCISFVTTESFDLQAKLSFWCFIRDAKDTLSDVRKRKRKKNAGKSTWGKKSVIDADFFYKINCTFNHKMFYRGSCCFHLLQAFVDLFSIGIGEG